MKFSSIFGKKYVSISREYILKFNLISFHLKFLCIKDHEVFNFILKEVSFSSRKNKSTNKKYYAMAEKNTLKFFSEYRYA
jgi:hypothetical protein